jgi:hypothetical protein
MFAPNPTSSMAHPRKRAAAARASTTTASLARLVAKEPPRFAFYCRRYDVIASITESGTCVPPGPSKNAVLRSSAENRSRTAPTS